MRTRNSRMRKPVRQNGIVAGVCGGLGAYFGVSPWLFRILFLIAALPGGVPGLLIYFLLALWMPSRRNRLFI